MVSFLIGALDNWSGYQGLCVRKKLIQCYGSDNELENGKIEPSLTVYLYKFSFIMFLPINLHTHTHTHTHTHSYTHTHTHAHTCTHNTLTGTQLFVCTNINNTVMKMFNKQQHVHVLVNETFVHMH